MFLKRLLPLLLTVLPAGALAAEEEVEKVSLSGTVETLACAAACGVCCPSYSIVDTSGTLSLQVGNSFVDWAKISDDGKVHQISGFFYQTSGQCGIGECTMFTVEEFENQQITEPAFNAATGTLDIQSVVINNIDNSRYKVSLSSPFNVYSATEITADNIIPQGGGCSEESAICTDGTLCVSYFGIAGAQGPEFKSCETPCSQPGALCPRGQSCITIADGPGQVCRVD
jgi:hypothetical protein